MRRGSIGEGRVIRCDYPARGIVQTDGVQVRVHGALEGELVRYRVTKHNSSRTEGQTLEVLERAACEVPADCPHYASCGGCIYRTLTPEDELRLKEKQILRLLSPAVRTDEKAGDEEEQLPQDGCRGTAPPWFEGVKQSPDITGYRNKMELSFGDREKGGELQLGLHARGSFYDILTVDSCRIMPQDFLKIASCVLQWARETGMKHYHKITHQGYFRHLLLSRAVYTGEILADLVTSSQYGAAADEKPGTGDTAALTEDISDGNQREEADLQTLKERLLALDLDGRIAGILHTVNDAVSDTIRNEHTDILFGTDVFTEHLLGMKFRITPFSFFQTNSRGAEVLYSTVREYIGDTKDRVIFDLYSGTGTIAQILAPVARHVTGVEIVPEAVRSARENAKLNGLTNCDFICGDVLKAVDELEEKPDLIVLDPPREGIHPGAMPKIIAFGVERIVYISCKATSLQRDLAPLQEAGYRVERACAVNLFPGTEHVECVALLVREFETAKAFVNVSLNMDVYRKFKEEQK